MKIKYIAVEILDGDTVEVVQDAKGFPRLVIDGRLQIDFNNSDSLQNICDGFDSYLDKLYYDEEQL